MICTLVSFWLAFQEPGLERALSLEREGRLKEASRAYIDALGEHPDDPYLHYALARVLLTAGDLTEALLHAERAGALAPRQASAQIVLGSIHRALENPELAEEAFRKALEVDPASDEARLALADFYQSRQEFEKARIELVAYLGRHPDDTEVLYFLGTVLSYQNKFDEAREVFIQVLSRDPRHARAWFRKAHVEAQRPALVKDALASYEKSLALDPAYAYAHYEYGTLLGKLDRVEEAVAAMRTAVELDPKLVEAYYALGTLLSRAGRTAEAESYLETFKRERDRASQKSALAKRALAAFGRGRELIEQNRMEEAIQSFLEMTELEPKAHQGYAFLAKAYGSLGQIQVAAGYARRAMELSPGTSEYPYLLSRFLREQGDLKGALDAARRAAALNPQNALLQNALGLLLLDAGDVRQAVDAFEQATERDPDDPAYCLNLSAAYTRLGRTEESAKALERYRAITRR